MLPQTPNPLLNLVPIAAIFIIFYVLLIRPQQKQQKEHEKMLAELKKGDKILTSGGFYGTIVGVKGDDLEVRFAENVKLTVARSAVAKVLGNAETKNDSAQAKSGVVVS